MRTKFLFLALSALATLVAKLPAQIFSSLHSFASTDGANPYAGLILSGNKLYGTTQKGGSANNGTVFKMNTDGTGFATLYTFTNGSDGANPIAGLALSGNTLYGAAANGGSSSNGTVFKLNINGTDFAVLHSFTALSSSFPVTNSDGTHPAGGLILSGSTLYGSTQGGGPISGPFLNIAQNGTVFRVNTDGTDFTTLFSDSLAAHPLGRLILSGNTLYGTADDGGSGRVGSVFKLNSDGTGFATIHTFTNVGVNHIGGFHPYAGLILSNDILYGTTYLGGTGGNGTVFKVNTNGAGFMILHHFTSESPQGTNSDGSNPTGDLVLAGDTLYGTTSAGGSHGSGYGTVFKMKTDGTGFVTLYTFTAGNDGANPFAGLVLSGGTLYGTAHYAGDGGDWGTVFKLDLSIPLNVQLLGNALILSWTNSSFSLQSAPTLSDTFTNISGAASPYTNAPTDSQMFFRLQAN